MHESAESPQTSKVEQDRERRLEKEIEILKNVARTHLDELLSAEDWKRHGLQEVNPIDKDGFEWSVYVTEREGSKSVGVKMMDDQGIFDIREFGILDDTVPVSTKQNPVDEIARSRSEQHHAKREQKKAKRRAEMERKRGFPEGKYVLHVTYPHRSGEMRTVKVQEINVETESTRDDVLRDARSWLQMYGLHNYGMDFSKSTDRQGTTPVQAALKKEGVEVPFECSIDASGFIVKEEK